MPVLPKWTGSGIFISLYFQNQVTLNLFQYFINKGVQKQAFGVAFIVFG